MEPNGRMIRDEQKMIFVYKIYSSIHFILIIVLMMSSLIIMSKSDDSRIKMWSFGYFILYVVQIVYGCVISCFGYHVSGSDGCVFFVDMTTLFYTIIAIQDISRTGIDQTNIGMNVIFFLYLFSASINIGSIIPYKIMDKLGFLKRCLHA